MKVVICLALLASVALAGVFQDPTVNLPGIVKGDWSFKYKKADKSVDCKADFTLSTDIGDQGREVVFYANAWRGADCAQLNITNETKLSFSFPAQSSFADISSKPVTVNYGSGQQVTFTFAKLKVIQVDDENEREHLSFQLNIDFVGCQAKRCSSELKFDKWAPLRQNTQLLKKEQAVVSNVAGVLKGDWSIQYKKNKKAVDCRPDITVAKDFGTEGKEVVFYADAWHGADCAAMNISAKDQLSFSVLADSTFEKVSKDPISVTFGGHDAVIKFKKLKVVAVDEESEREHLTYELEIKLRKCFKSAEDKKCTLHVKLDKWAVFEGQDSAEVIAA